MKIYAHRGSSLIWPENTLLAFDRAHAAGATGFETDLRLSRDGRIILAHDDNLARFGHPDKTVSQLDFSDLSQITIPSPEGSLRDNLITLEMMLTQYPEHDYIFDCKISAELLFQKLKGLLAELKYERLIWFLTWSKQADEYVRQYFPDHYLFPRMNRTILWALPSILGLGRLFEPSNEIVSLPAFHLGLPVLKKGQVKAIRDKRKKKFVGYLINSEKEYNRCKKCGIDTVLTDRPDLIAKLERENRQ